METKRKKPKRKTAFVPSVVFTTAVAGVVPACVVGCSSSSSGGSLPGVANCAYAGNNGNCPTVAAVGYMAFDAGDGGAHDATSEAQAADGATDATEAGDDAAGGDASGDAKGD